MAAKALIPIEDFVTGHLPALSALSGRPADGVVPIEGGRDDGVFWPVLLLAGPLGLLFLALRRRPEVVSGYVPMTAGELEAMNASARRSATWNRATLVAAVAMLALALIAPPLQVFGSPVVLPLTAFVIGLVGAAALTFEHERRYGLNVELVNGGRWVQVWWVSDGFAHAIDRETRRRSGSELRDVDR